ncbi:hypothetical protein ANN_10876 [Periplaneta americana]|uniref:Uncharacterized protein n=1 Tax=Periplaneta americana TaxID=6978 RepID=A0ABQ8T3H0_PERAM|nr:hypothetical protein ANN_10876 [Periplaneta americana]
MCIEVLTEIRPFGEVLTEIRPFGKVLTEIHPFGKVLTEIRTFGKVLTEIRTFGKVLTEIRLFGKVLTEIRPFGKVLTEIRPFVLTEIRPFGKVLTEIRPFGKVLTEIRPFGKVLTEIRPFGKVLTEIRPFGKVLTEIRLFGKVLTEIRPFVLTEIRPFGKVLTEIRPFGKVLTEIRLFGKVLTEIRPFSKVLTEIRDVCPKYFPKNLILKNPQSLFLSQSESPSFTAIQNNRWLFNNVVSTTTLFSVDEIGDSEMKPRIRHRLPGIHLTVGENLGKNPTSSRHRKDFNFHAPPSNHVRVSSTNFIQRSSKNNENSVTAAVVDSSEQAPTFRLLYLGVVQRGTLSPQQMGKHEGRGVEVKAGDNHIIIIAVTAALSLVPSLETSLARVPAYSNTKSLRSVTNKRQRVKFRYLPSNSNRFYFPQGLTGCLPFLERRVLPLVERPEVTVTITNGGTLLLRNKNVSRVIPQSEQPSKRAVDVAVVASFGQQAVCSSEASFETGIRLECVRSCVSDLAIGLSPKYCGTRLERSGRVWLPRECASASNEKEGVGKRNSSFGKRCSAARSEEEELRSRRGAERAECGHGVLDALGCINIHPSGGRYTIRGLQFEENRIMAKSKPVKKYYFRRKWDYDYFVAEEDERICESPYRRTAYFTSTLLLQRVSYYCYYEYVITATTSTLLLLLRVRYYCYYEYVITDTTSTLLLLLRVRYYCYYEYVIPVTTIRYYCYYEYVITATTRTLLLLLRVRYCCYYEYVITLLRVRYYCYYEYVITVTTSTILLLLRVRYYCYYEYVITVTTSTLLLYYEYDITATTSTLLLLLRVRYYCYYEYVIADTTSTLLLILRVRYYCYYEYVITVTTSTILLLLRVRNYCYYEYVITATTSTLLLLLRVRYYCYYEYVITDTTSTLLLLLRVRYYCYYEYVITVTTSTLLLLLRVRYYSYYENSASSYDDTTRCGLVDNASVRRAENPGSNPGAGFFSVPLLLHRMMTQNICMEISYVLRPLQYLYYVNTKNISVNYMDKINSELTEAHPSQRYHEYELTSS